MIRNGIQEKPMEKLTTEESRCQTIELFWETVPIVWNLVRVQLHAVAAERFDINMEQFHVMRHIRGGLTSVSDIANARQISRSAVSQAAEQLVEKGLISRRQEAGDRRFVHLALTPEGENLLDKVFQQNRAWMMERMAPLSAEDLALISAGLVLLKSAFDAPAEKKQVIPLVSNGI